MPTTRILITFIVVLAGMALAPVLPKNVNLRPTAISPELPTFVGEWFGEKQSVSQRELDVLAKDTVFSRSTYLDSRGREVTVSIVISGHDLNNSIHRPERCLPAQGWTVNKSTKTELSIPSLSVSPLPLKQLECYAFTEVPPQPGSKQLKEGGTQRIYHLNNYFFIGAETITPSHYRRTLQDMADRAFIGQNQQWAYVTFAVNYGHHVMPNTNVTPEQRAEVEKQIEAQRQDADKALREFMAEILPELLPKWRTAPAKS